MASQAYAQVVAEEQGEPAGLTIQLADFLLQPLALRRRILETACWHVGCRPTCRQIAQLLFLAGTGAEGASLHLAQGLRVVKAEGRLSFRYPQGRQAVRGNLSGAGTEELSFCRELPGPGEYFLADLGVKVTLRLLAPLPPDWESQAPATLYCDAGKVCFPMVVRSSQKGDRFHPLGAPGSKKVGDFFTDRKIPVAQRNRIPILTDQEGIIAILGMRPDQRAAITPSTRRILAVSLHPAAVGENGFTEKAIHGK
jgi:tRNA(Ile)-lysidine synthase